MTREYGLPDLGHSIADLVWAEQRVVATALGMFVELWAPAPLDSVERDDRRERLRIRLWHLRRAYTRVVGDDPSALTAALGDLNQVVEDLGPALLVWVECVEALVQEAERRIGPESSKGPVKAAHVKAALTHVLVEADIAIPGVPSALSPLILEAVIEWTIDGTVQILNSNGAWQLAAGAATRSTYLGRILRSAGRLLAWPLHVLGGWFETWVRRRILAGAKLTPEARSLVAHLESAGYGDPAALARRGANLLAIVGRNRKRLLGIVELISIGAKEAERITGLTGPEKKRYVCDLIMIFIEDQGIANPSGVAYPVIERIVDFVVDAVVHVLKKRSVLPRKTQGLRHGQAVPRRR